MLPRFMPGLLIIFSVVFVGLFLLIRFLEGTSVFYPSRNIDSTPASAGMKYEDLFLKTTDGLTINAWLVKSSPTAPIVIFAHGNAGTMGQRVMKVKFFHDLGFNIVIFDYRGYGRSSGSPSEGGVYLDAQAVYDYLQGRDDMDHSRIIAYGASLGGAVMSELAMRRKVAGLIIESSFTCARDMARRIYPGLPTFMMSIKFDLISKMDKITAPKVFLHSQEDQTVPYSMGQALYNRAKEPKIFITTHGGHNEGALVSDPKIKEQLLVFLQKHSLL